MSTGTLELPNGELDLGPEDLFVAHVDGGLWVHPGALGDAPGAPWQLADFEHLGARFLPYTEVTSPIQATWASVAGDVDGVVYYGVRFDLDPSMSGTQPGDFMELPTFFAVAAENADSIPFDVGLSALALSPDHTRLATHGWGESTGAVIDLATGSYRPLRTGTLCPNGFPDCYTIQGDLIWSADGESIVSPYWYLRPDDGAIEYGLMTYDARSPFVLGTPIPTDVTPGYVDWDRYFAGRGPDGEIAVVVGDATGTVIRFFDASTLAEVPEMQRTLSPGATSVHLADDGVGLLWVDDTTLWYLPDGGDVRDLGSGYTEAWYAV